MLCQQPVELATDEDSNVLSQVLVFASERTLRKKDMGTLLVCGETNACADNLVAGALQAGLSVARVGAPARVLSCFACVPL
jgi:hypothetical protein